MFVVATFIEGTHNSNSHSQSADNYVTLPHYIDTINFTSCNCDMYINTTRDITQSNCWIE